MTEPHKISSQAIQDEAFSLEGYRQLARHRLAPEVFDYIDCGACDEATVRANRFDFDSIRLLPLCMRDVKRIELPFDLLGSSFALPIGISPMAFHCLVHEQGERATACAASRLNVPFTVSAMSSVSIEELAKTSDPSRLWCHTYLFRDRNVTRDLVHRAARAGFRAVMLTAGCPAPGKRDRNLRNCFVLPETATAANFARSAATSGHNNPIHSLLGAELDPSVTWKDVEWLCGESPLPVLLKGILNPADVERALASGVAGLVVSNHGGRQLDTTESTIRALPAISATLHGRLPLLIDSGFRRGTDVLKALALGADAVLLGRPILWGLAANGEEGVRDVIEILAAEMRLAMQLAGCANVLELREQSHLLVRM